MLGPRPCRVCVIFDALDNDASCCVIGESLLEYNDTTRAERNFQRAIELRISSYRGAVGLADVALRSGKLAPLSIKSRGR